MYPMGCWIVETQSKPNKIPQYLAMSFYRRAAKIKTSLSKKNKDF